MNFRKVSQFITLTIIVTLITLVAGRLVLHAQEQKQSKFRHAPAGAKGVKVDLYDVSFDQKLSVEDFEKELKRVIEQYDAELADPAEFGPDTKTKISDLRWAALRVPEVRAKQIAEDSAVIEVTQEYEIPVHFNQKSQHEM